MKKLMSMARQFRDDENGAAMVEYTVLLALIAGVTIATIVLVSTWVNGTWTNLNTTLTTEAPTS